jgi:leader peptidase (prepilin peptidase)/N-methyltransferase
VSIFIMGIFGFLAGFALDEIIARFAREPYARREADEREPKHPSIELSSEAGVLTMPRMLTTAWPLRKVIVVTVATVVFGVVGARYSGDAAHLTIVALYASVLIVCAATDLLAYRVPNAVTYPAIIGALAVGMIINGADRFDVAFGGLLAGGVLFVPAIITGGAMGMGDVKLALFIGFALGLSLVVPAMLLMAIAGGIVAAVLLITRLRGKGDPIPYAPFIAGAALFVMLTQGTAFQSL